jgi:hypothetical protein
MNYDAVLVVALTLLQQETSEQLVGVLPKQQNLENLRRNHYAPNVMC